MDNRFEGGIFQGMRECGECTFCCEGYLRAKIQATDGTPEVRVDPWNPCIFRVQGGCGNYENRPIYPCRDFQCEWLSHPDVFPEKMRPDKCNKMFVCQAPKMLIVEPPVIYKVELKRIAFARNKNTDKLILVIDDETD